MVNVIGPWSIRSGCYNNGALAGVFAFNTALGGGNDNIYISFRQVLAPVTK